MRTTSPLLGLGLAVFLLPACGADSFEAAEVGGTAGTAGTSGASSGSGGSAEAGASGRATAGAGQSGSGGTGARSGAAGMPASGSGGLGGAPAGAGGGAGTAAGGAGSSGAAGDGGAGNAAGAGGNGGSGGSAGAAAGAGGAGAGGAGAGGAGAGGAGAGGAGGGGAAGVGGQGGGASGSGAGGGGSDCPVIYVGVLQATKSATGCDPALPFGSITEALALARSLPALAGVPAGRQIQVCEGLYTETNGLHVDIPVSIRGDYDCKSGLPGTARARAVGEQGTLISHDGQVALRIAPPANGEPISPANEISGLVFLPASTTSALDVPLRGVHLEGGASPTLLRISARTPAQLNGTGTNAGSVGLLVEAGSSAVIKGCKFAGGKGSFTDAFGAASAGAVIDQPGTGFVFFDNEAIGGDGTTAAGQLGVGSVGVFLRVGATPVVLQASRLTGGHGSGAGAGFDTSSAGLYVHQADKADKLGGPGTVTVLDSVIRGGSGASDGTGPAYAAGLRAAGSSPKVRLGVVVERSRIYGGDSVYTQGDTGKTHAFLGVDTRFTVRSSVIHGGGVKGLGRLPRAARLEQSTFDGSFVTVIPGGTKTGGSAFTGGNATGFHFFHEGNALELNDSLVLAAQGATGFLYGEGPACGPPAAGGYQAKLTRVTYVHPEPFADPAESNLPGGFTDGTAECPNERLMPANDGADSGDPHLTLASCIHAEPESGGLPPTGLGCVSSEGCFVKVFKPGDLDDDAFFTATLGIVCKLPPSIATSAVVTVESPKDLYGKPREPGAGPVGATPACFP